MVDDTRMIIIQEHCISWKESSNSPDVFIAYTVISDKDKNISVYKHVKLSVLSKELYYN